MRLSDCVYVSPVRHLALEELSIAGNPIDQRGALALAAAVHAKPKLAMGLSFENIGALAAERPMHMFGNLDKPAKRAPVPSSRPTQEPALPKGPAFEKDEENLYRSLYGKFLEECSTLSPDDCSWPSCRLLKATGLVDTRVGPAADATCLALSERMTSSFGIEKTDHNDGADAFLAFLLDSPVGILARAVHRAGRISSTNLQRPPPGPAPWTPPSPAPPPAAKGLVAQEFIIPGTIPGVASLPPAAKAPSGQLQPDALRSPPLPSPDDFSLWLHIPKCGSSFGTSVASYGLSDVLRPNHVPLSASIGDAQLSVVVTMLREPDQRLLSAYSWIKKVPGCCTSDWGWEMRVFSQVRRDISRGVPPSDTIAGFTGCQTNMILGRGCMVQGNITTKDMTEAKRRISLFRFVGLQENWKLSICLFNFIMTGRRFFADYELDHKAPGTGLKILGAAPKKFKVPTPIGNHNASLLGPDHFDVADTAIFLFAKERFLRECKAYNITDATCLLKPTLKRS